MRNRGDIINRIQVNTPCNEDWDSMTGNDLVRFCSHCAKDVHNISAMTRIEAERLVHESNGNLCLRYYRNPDGTKITADYPTRFHQLSRRVSRLAAGAFTVALSISSTVAAQSSGNQTATVVSMRNMAKDKFDQTGPFSGSISGVLYDYKNEIFPNVKVRLESRESEQVFETESNIDGRYAFNNLPPGVYQISAPANFRFATVSRIILTTNQTLTFDFAAKDNQIISGIMELIPPSDPLVRAAFQNDVKSIRALLDAGVDVNTIDESVDTTALFEAVSRNNVEIAKALLAAGANPNGVEVTDSNPNGTVNLRSVPLHAIRRETSSEMIDVLVTAGANPNLKDDDGATAIMFAARNGNARIIKKLIKRHVDVNVTDSNGRTPLMEALDRHDLDIVKMLIAAGANVNVVEYQNRTLLVQACADAQAEIVAALLDAKPILEAKDNEGATALLTAAFYSRTEIIQLLINAGARIDEADNDGFTALMNSAARANIAAVKILIAAGADINARDKSGSTALTIAQGHNTNGYNTEVIQFLKAHGAIE